MTLTDLRSTGIINAGLCKAGRCVFCKPGDVHPYEYVIPVPDGRVLPVCLDCLKWYANQYGVPNGEPENPWGPNAWAGANAF